jgi:hypothetical protein
MEKTLDCKDGDTGVEIPRLSSPPDYSIPLYVNCRYHVVWKYVVQVRLFYIGVKGAAILFYQQVL